MTISSSLLLPPNSLHFPLSMDADHFTPILTFPCLVFIYKHTLCSCNIVPLIFLCNIFLSQTPFLSSLCFVNNLYTSLVMSRLISYLDQFPMEKLLLSVQNIPLAILVIGLVEFLFFQIDVNWFERVCKYFSRSFSSIQYQTVQLSDVFREKVGTTKKLNEFELTKTNCLLSEQVDDGSLHIEDVEMVIGRLGNYCHPCEDKRLQERLGIEYFSSMFEEDEPSLGEVKEAFDVFDLNRDGFIDAMELQRVVCVLGVSDGSQIENCKQMIREFDENGDGRIDFREFVKLMENSLC